jgi:hypothetical protein
VDALTEERCADQNRASESDARLDLVTRAARGFVTVSLANGKTEQWVTDRTGHRSSQMLALDTRQARQWSELMLGALQPMDALLPEMAKPAEGGPSLSPRFDRRQLLLPVGDN